MLDLAALDTRIGVASLQKLDETLLGENPNIIGYCPNCGKPIIRRSGKGRQKVFCSKKCCDHYAYTHPNYETWSGIETRVCEYCGKEYTTYRKNSQHRRYCSISCSSRAMIARRKKNDLAKQEAAQGQD